MQPQQAQFEAIGTSWAIEVYEPVATPRWRQLELAIARRIDAFDQHYSRFRADSLIGQMAREAGEYELPADARPLFDLYQRLYQLTDGAMTPLIGQTLSDAGYDAQYSLQPGRVNSPPTWDAALDYHFPRLTLRQPALLDVGAAGKGYLVDVVSDIIEQAGISHYCVDAGGDMRYRGASAAPLRVGLEHPGVPGQVVGVAELVNASLCGSASNRRTWGKYHHILHPGTLESPRHLQAVWVVAANTLLADALTTALYFVEPPVLQQQFEFDYALVTQHNEIIQSLHFPGEFFAA